MYEPFEAVAEYGYNGMLYTATIEVDLLPNSSEQCMMVRGDEEYIYITKEQAMKFFGLVDAEGSCYDPEGYPPSK